MFQKTKYPPRSSPHVEKKRLGGADNGIGNTHASPLAAAPWCCLTESDIQLLEEAAKIYGGRDSAIHRALAHKIQNTVVELSEDVPAGYVRLNSRVIFRVNDLMRLNRVLVHWNTILVPRRDLSLATPWGIALLGTRPGYEGPVYWRGGISEMIRVEAVDAAPTLSSAEGKIIGLASRRIAPAVGRSILVDDTKPTAA